MKKIKNMGHLREQKAILEARRLQAEKNVRLHWNNFKEEFTPSSLASGTIHNLTQAAMEKDDKKNILKSTFTYGLTLLAKKLVDAADDQLKKVLKK